MKHEDISYVLREMVADGQLAPGGRLPSENEIAVKFDVSRGTVRKALSTLREEGLIEAVQGAGSFVRKRGPMMRHTRTRLSQAERQAGRGGFLYDAFLSNLIPSINIEVSISYADTETAETLECSVGDEILVRRRIMALNKRPIQISTSYLRRDLTRNTPIEREDTGPGGTYSRLEEYGFRPARFLEVVGTRRATSEEGKLLNLATGDPVLVVTRTAFTEDAIPVEILVSVIAGGSVELCYEIADS